MIASVACTSSTSNLASECQIEQLEPAISRRMLGYGPDLILCRASFDAGAISAVHSHPHSQSSLVESGRFRVMVGAEERELTAGDAYHVGPHLDHGATCIEAGTLLDCFSPARADFLSGEG